ncbi:MAG: hypothetical protein ACOVOQ_07530 [Flavobacterium sp.]
MQNTESYQELETSRNLLQKLWHNLQIDKDNQNKLIEYMKQENEQLKQKIRDLECINEYLQADVKREVNNVIADIVGEYQYNYNN